MPNDIKIEFPKKMRGYLIIPMTLPPELIGQFHEELEDLCKKYLKL